MRTDGARVLIVEDEPTIAGNLYGYLERQGLVPDAAYDGHGALTLLRTGGFGAMVLDLGLPGLSGMDVLRALQRDTSLWCPVLVLTARDRIEDRLLAFDLGAEDYLVKPFALAEVFARLRVLLRRGWPDDARAMLFGDLSYDPRSHAVTLRGQPLALPRKSVLLLEMLLRATGRPVSQLQIRATLWPEGPPSERALNDQIHLLRRRLREVGGPDVVAVHGLGWQLTGAAEDGPHSLRSAPDPS
ncbi:MAG: response regulator transcription factor [Castellaniella sp.]|uniref:response regulator transcription factor n=1 Tax=Castellaniella sp. TaxID=1955812 RepID=UPI001202CC3C|nr:response regulator transcription factor [Castellaniella sp.]TAN26064.1 MAG: response regulator transcription factor [Castellaniella sp.]